MLSAWLLPLQVGWLVPAGWLLADWPRCVTVGGLAVIQLASGLVLPCRYLEEGYWFSSVSSWLQAGLLPYAPFRCVNSATARASLAESLVL
jgi:hypothetical protein